MRRAPIPNPSSPQASARTLSAFVGIFQRGLGAALVGIVFLVLNPSWDMLHQYAPHAHTAELS